MHFLFILMLAGSTQLVGADIWERGTTIPYGGRANPYGLNEIELKASVNQGRSHALVYPVEVTGILIPLRPVQNFLDYPTINPLRVLMKTASMIFTRIDSFKAAMHWAGLHDYPADAGTESSAIPLPASLKVGDAMGLSPIQTEDGLGFNIGCAGCHTGQLFGQPIIGLTNRFPRANVFFIRGKSLARMISTPLFALSMGTDLGEAAMYKKARSNVRFVSGKRPLVLGLDTSLAHVALSLGRRTRDAYATKDWGKPFDPDDDPLESAPADSKPAVWWNLKYKNRWLSDGSVVSGNPIITNLLWNEIGRGTDLHELEAWLGQNERRVRELTSAVFASEAPHITEFFPAEKINLESAKRGQKLFSAHCVRCHGEYLKAWDSMTARSLSPAARLRTTRVNYAQDTPVVDVGTDSNRRKGMRSLLRLNELQISKVNGVIIEEQVGYVPPPLVGIWARWPYFHNNSAPTLCAVLSPGPQRPVTYWAGEPYDTARDFDFECNGYPAAEKMPATWSQSEDYFFDTRRPGLGNSGHDSKILVRDGREIFSMEDRKDLIQFLQTL